MFVWLKANLYNFCIQGSNHLSIKFLKSEFSVCILTSDVMLQAEFESLYQPKMVLIKILKLILITFSWKIKNEDAYIIKKKDILESLYTLQ